MTCEIRLQTGFNKSDCRKDGDCHPENSGGDVFVFCGAFDFLFPVPVPVLIQPIGIGYCGFIALFVDGKCHGGQFLGC